MIMYRKVYDALKTGGWFDQAEPNILFCSDYCEFEVEHPFALWSKVMIDAGRKAGMEFEVGAKMEERLASVGLSTSTFGVRYGRLNRGRKMPV
jgi:hypothetical protein